MEKISESYEDVLKSEFSMSFPKFSNFLIKNDSKSKVGVTGSPGELELSMSLLPYRFNNCRALRTAQPSHNQAHHDFARINLQIEALDLVLHDKKSGVLIVC